MIKVIWIALHCISVGTFEGLLKVGGVVTVEGDKFAIKQIRQCRSTAEAEFWVNRIQMPSLDWTQQDLLKLGLDAAAECSVVELQPLSSAELSRITVLKH